MSETTNQHSDNPGFEKEEINVGKVVFFGLASIIVVVVVLILAVDYFTAVKDELVREVVLKPQSLTLRELRVREAEELDNYKLLDSANDVYRIPVQRAMELVADEAYQMQATTGGRR